MKIHQALTILLAFLPGPYVNLTQAENRAPIVQTGIDVLIADNFQALAGKRIGLITNPTGITSDLQSTIDVLHAAPQVKLVALFGPEHGVRGDMFAGSKVEDGRDPATGLPVYSPYGKNRRPTPEILDGLDLLIYDIQDTGARSYTYISTMAAAMEAAAGSNIPFMVLDRPNPLTGDRVEGRPLDLRYRSFVGYFPIPYLYGMTCGELAQMANNEGWLKGGVSCDLSVVEMRSWRREMWFDETRLPWVPTSPQVPHSSTSLFYAATGIMGELQVISEGVGYTFPFELAGAPFIKDAPRFAKALNARKLPGISFRPIFFKPYYIARVQGKLCGGAQIHIIDRNQADLTGIQFHVMDTVQQLFPEISLFGGKRDRMFDQVCGTDRIRQMFLEQKPATEIIHFWNSGRESYMKKRAKYLRYE